MLANYWKLLLKADAAFLLLASMGGLATDIAGSFFDRGASAAILRNAPGAGIGFIEAHGLAFILGALFWRAAPSRTWHTTAAAVHLLLGGANLAFWRFFIDTDLLVVGYATTALHAAFAALQIAAALAAAPDAPR